MGKKKRRIIISRGKGREVLIRFASSAGRSQTPTPLEKESSTQRLGEVTKEKTEISEVTKEIQTVKLNWFGEGPMLIPDLIKNGDKEGLSGALLEFTNRLASGRNPSEELTEEVFREHPASEVADAISESIRRWSTPERE